MVKTLTQIDHIRTRLGMYVPTDHANKPIDEAWSVLLDELVADGVRAFASGDASRLEIRCCHETGEIAIGHDGPGNLCHKLAAAFQEGSGTCMGGTYGSFWHESDKIKAAYVTRYDLMTYAILSALSKKMAVETYVDGEWRATVCSDGKIGAEERLLSGLIPTDARRFVWVRFIIDPKYIAEDKGRSPYSADLLQEFGRSLACAYPGLIVAVNEREYMFPQGIEYMVKARMAIVGSETLMEPRIAESNGVAVACGIVRRRNGGRKITGSAFVNGREIKSHDVLVNLIESVGNCLLDCRSLRSRDYEFVFAASVKMPIQSEDTSLPNVADICSWTWHSSSGASDGISRYVTSFGRCLLKLLGGYMK